MLVLKVLAYPPPVTPDNVTSVLSQRINFLSRREWFVGFQWNFKIAKLKTFFGYMWGYLNPFAWFTSSDARSDLTDSPEIVEYPDLEFDQRHEISFDASKENRETDQVAHISSPTTSTSSPSSTSNNGIFSTHRIHKWKGWKKCNGKSKRKFHRRSHQKY